MVKMALIGIVGKPNAGKSTFFSALTLIDVKIAPFPFTTIEPNRGIAYIRKPCPHTLINKSCEPKDSLCEKGIRYIPIEIIDVAGLVPEAHKGKGLGLQFLDDIREADAIIQVIDGSGKTNLEGNPCENCDPLEEVKFLEKELEYWLYTIIDRNINRARNRGIEALKDVLSSLKVSISDAKKIIEDKGLNEKILWSDEEKMIFAKEVRKLKPILIAVNKGDIMSKEQREKIKKELKDRCVICSASYEFALRKAAKNGIIKYFPGDSDFEILNANDEQKKALEKIREYLREEKTTGVQETIEKVVNDLLGLVAVYPVEDENKWCDKKGNVLPNVFLMPKNSTPLDLAAKIHSDFEKKFIAAIDAKKKVKIGKEYILKDGDVIKIIAGA